MIQLQQFDGDRAGADVRRIFLRAPGNQTAGKGYSVSTFPCNGLPRGGEESRLTAQLTSHAGEAYVTAITAHDSDREARQAFRDLVLSNAAPGSCIFDFGAGPGLDAKFYARHGFRVVAYDVDARMCSYFARHCSSEIEAGSIALYQCDYPEFLDRKVRAIRDAYPVTVVTANFAPLSLIDDPHELFAGLHTLTRPNAILIASVLNPSFIGDMKYLWWWANRSNYRRQGQFHMAGASGNIYRRSFTNFTAQAAPYFSLRHIARGLPDNRPTHGICRRLGLLTSQFTFLVFARRQPCGSHYRGC